MLYKRAWNVADKSGSRQFSLMGPGYKGGAVNLIVWHNNLLKSNSVTELFLSPMIRCCETPQSLIFILGMQLLAIAIASFLLQLEPILCQVLIIKFVSGLHIFCFNIGIKLVFEFVGITRSIILF